MAIIDGNRGIDRRKEVHPKLTYHGVVGMLVIDGLTFQPLFKVLKVLDAYYRTRQKTFLWAGIEHSGQDKA